MTSPWPYTDLSDAPAGSVILIQPGAVQGGVPLLDAGEVVLIKRDEPRCVVHNGYPSFTIAGAPGYIVTVPCTTPHTYLGRIFSDNPEQMDDLMVHLTLSAAQALKDFFMRRP